IQKRHFMAWSLAHLLPHFRLCASRVPRSSPASASLFPPPASRPLLDRLQTLVGESSLVGAREPLDDLLEESLRFGGLLRCLQLQSALVHRRRNARRIRESADECRVFLVSGSIVTLGRKRLRHEKHCVWNQVGPRIFRYQFAERGASSNVAALEQLIAPSLE